MADFFIAADDPRSAEPLALLHEHLAFARRHTPPKEVHALDLEALQLDNITFFSTRVDDEVVSIGALKRLDAHHAELKSVHTAESLRGLGAGRAMVDHLVAFARANGYLRVSLETGSMEAFEPSRALYRSAGFDVCEPFADYSGGPNSVCMTLHLGSSSDNS